MEERKSVLEAMQSRLDNHPQITSKDIQLSIEDGKLVLRGTVKDRKEARIIVSEAIHLMGAGQVINELGHRGIEGYMPGKGDIDREDSSGGFTEQSL